MLGVIVFAVSLLALRPGSYQQAGEVALLFGGMVLGYGFANLGLQTGLAPVPLTELLLIALLPSAFAQHATPPRKYLMPLVLFALLVSVRLVFDYPRWGTFAIRDATLAIEAFVLVLGYRAAMRDGFVTWIRRFKILFFIVLCYGSLYPFEDSLVRIAPTVGLQRVGIPLLGEFSGMGSAALTSLLFFAIYARGWRRIVLVMWALGIVALFQARGLYLALPVAALALAWSLRKPTQVALRTAGLGLLAVIALLSLSTLGLEGRVGPVNLEFYADHLRTLIGEEGPASGTIEQRQEWAQATLDLWLDSPTTFLVGVGLGPDLTFGFSGTGGVDVRKPHNDYLEVLARTGLLGIVFFALMVYRPFIRIGRAARTDGDERGRFCAWVFSASAVYLSISATQPVLAFPMGTIPLFFLLGMGLAIALRADDRALMQFQHVLRSRRAPSIGSAT